MCRPLSMALTGALLGVFASTLSAVTIAPLPGVACSDLGVLTGPCTGITSSGAAALADPTFNLFFDPGILSLGIFVVPGDLVMFEHSNGSLTNPVSWSDVVRFANGPNGSTAQTFADAETGPLLPPGFVLSANATSIVETQTGKGNDSDFTVYNPSAGSVTYNVFSDAALTPEPTEPNEGAPEPSTILLLLGGTLILGVKGRIG